MQIEFTQRKIMKWKSQKLYFTQLLYYKGMATRAFNKKGVMCSSPELTKQNLTDFG